MIRSWAWLGGGVAALGAAAMLYLRGRADGAHEADRRAMHDYRATRQRMDHAATGDGDIDADRRFLRARAEGR